MLRRASLIYAASAALLAVASENAGRRWWSYVEYLASDQLEGRLTGSVGHRKAVGYVATHFMLDGLQPAGESGYTQTVRFHSRTVVEKDSRLTLIRADHSKPLVLGEDAILSVRIKPDIALKAPLAFIGYGLTVPELKYDDLAGVSLQGKVAVYFSGGPASIPGALRAHYQSAEERWKSLKRAGAVGTMVIPDPHHMDIPWERIKVLRSQPAMSLADPALDETPGQKISVIVNPSSAAKILAGSNYSFEELQALADAGKPLPTFPLPETLDATVSFEEKEIESQNVAGLLRGSDSKLRDEIVVLSAHIDHLGVGEPVRGDRIYNGAMDNASGVATLLDVAASLRGSRLKLRRSVLFLIVTAEEKGLLGSRYFATRPTVPIESIVADLNVDMFLPIFPLKILNVLGLNDSDLGPLLRSVAEPMGVRIQDDPEPERNLFIRSDQYNFIKAGVPSIYFKLGFEKGSPEAALQKQWLTERYHAPSDDIHQPVDLGAAAAYNEIFLKLAQAVANRTERPRWSSDSFFNRYARNSGR